VPPEVSDNQLRLMAAIRDAHPQVQTSEFLGQVRNRERQPIGYDNARKQLGRLESRDTPLVHGEGAGRQRTWGLTATGLELINELSPARPNGASSVRPYVVLEELEIRELVRRLIHAGDYSAVDGIDTEAVLAALPDDFAVYAVAERVEARNTEHAYRQVAKGVFRRQSEYYEVRQNDDGDDVFTVPAVAVDAKRFQSKELDVNLDATVTIR
jgi:hypothetical protein